MLANMNVARADDVVNEANKGQNTGANLLLNYNLPSISNAPPMDPLGPNEINIQELFPGYDPSDPSQITDLSDMAGNPEDLSTQGVAQQFSLGAGSDETAEAYQGIDAGAVNPHAAGIDLRTDGFLDRTREILAGNDPILDEILTACAEDVTAGDPGADTVTRLEDVWACSQLRVGVGGSCTVERDFSLQPVATQVVLEVVATGGSVGGYDRNHWSTLLDSLLLLPAGEPQTCVQVNPIGLDPEWYMVTILYDPIVNQSFYSSSKYCGDFSLVTPTAAECSTSGLEAEYLCRHTAGTSLRFLNPTHPTAGPIGSCAVYDELSSSDGVTPVDYTGCTVDRQNYCQTYRTEYENACNGIGSPALLNGTETITSPGLGPGFLETQAGQALFGTTVDLNETAFNPGDYGLVAGEYVISDHVVSGTGVTSSTIDYGGSYGTNWDFTSTISVTDSPGFTVEATLYEIVSNGFVFNGCSQADVQNVDSGTCSGSITCTDYTPPCRVVDGVTVCEPPSYSDGITEVLSPWSDFTTAVPEMCWFAEVEIIDCVGQTNCIGNPECVSDCADLPAELQAECLAAPCWVDAQGNTICLDDTSETWADNLGDVGFVDDCTELIGRPECSLLPQVSCVEGMEDDTDPTNLDLCNLRKRYFDCGEDVTVPGVPGADDVDVTCGAEVRCFGDECANTEQETNPDFVRATVAASSVTESTKDMECDIAGDPTSCKIFEGTDNRCKEPRGSYLGIIPDCCKESRNAGASAGDFITYMQLARYSYRLARDPIVASWLGQRQVLPSGLQNVVNAPAEVGRSAGRAVVSGFNSALEWAGFSPIDIATETEVVQSAVGASPTGFGPVQQFIAGGVDNFLRSIGADAFADSLFTPNADGTITDWASDGVGEMVGNVLQVIGFIYTVYSILKILGSIFFACEEEELAFGIQQVNRACHYVGTYCSKKVSFLGLKKCVIEKQTWCCFSSPFARILNEQLRLQGIGPEWGTAQAPNCDGVSIADLDTVDWSLVDLSEWEAILFEAGLVPDPRNPPLNFVPTDLHPGVSTGGPSGTTEGTTSTDLMEETIGIVMPTMDEGRFALDGAPLHQPDPELMPWYDDKN